MTNTFSYPEDTEEKTDLLARIHKAGRDLRRELDAIEQAELVLKQLKLRAADLSERILPELMDEADGLNSFSGNGFTITIKEDVRASDSEKGRAERHTWLRKQGHGGVIKHKVDVEFGAGEDQEAVEFIRVAEQMGVDYTEKSAVHPQTLAALVRELLREGKDCPMELLGAVRIRVAKLK